MGRLLSSEVARRGELFSRGDSAAATRLRTALGRLAETPHTTILVEGERGSWRSAFAARIHALSTRRAEPVVALAANEGRSFHSALLGPNGALELAGAGTLVLEEPATLPVKDQALLASILEDRSWVGTDGTERALAARVIATADENFDRATESGALLEDLAYRLNVLRLELPPLRDRADDLTVLLAALSELESAPHPAPLFEPDAIGPLADYDWPGNLRELEGAWLRAAALSPRSRLDLGRLAPGSSLESDSVLQPVDQSLKALEELWIRRVLAEERGNRTRTARALGIHRATLYHKLRDYGIE